jgi:hypothetical protein
VKILSAASPQLAAAPPPSGNGKSRISLDPVALLDWGKQNITGVGVAGGLIYIGSCVWHAWMHKSWDELATAAGYLGLFLIVVGAAFRSKRAADISTTNAAASEIGRVAILNAVTPADVKAVPTSPDRAIAREIVKQVRETGDAVLNGGGKNA